MTCLCLVEVINLSDQELSNTHYLGHLFVDLGTIVSAALQCIIMHVAWVTDFSLHFLHCFFLDIVVNWYAAVNDACQLTAIFWERPGNLVSECLHSEFYWRMIEMVVSTISWSYKTCMAPKLSAPTYQHPAVYTSDALPVTKLRASEFFFRMYWIMLFLLGSVQVDS